MSKFRWDGDECVSIATGMIVGRIYKHNDIPLRWKGICGDKLSSLFASADQARTAVEQYAEFVNLSPVDTNEITTRKNMLKEITTDAKCFLQEHRAVIYWLALLFLADHFFFAGAFRTRLNALVEKMIGKVEKKLTDTP